MFFQEDIRNLLPGFCVDIPWEKTPAPLVVCGITDRLTQLSRQQGPVKAACQAILILLVTSRNATFPVPFLCQHIPYQPCFNVSLPEVQLSVDPQPDLSGFAGAKCPCQYHMGEYKG